MPELNRRWIYPTVTASENKGIERIALSGEGMAHEVVGVDGSKRFGCRPMSGYQYARSLGTLQDFSSLGSAAPPVATKSSTVTDVFPVHFQIKENHFGYGFVYRVKTGANSAIYMDYDPTLLVGGNQGWRTTLISDHTTSSVDPDASMDVVSMGRYVFVFVKGRAVRVFYIESNGASTPVYSEKILDAGPGPSHFEKPFASATQWGNTSGENGRRFIVALETYDSSDTPTSLGEGDYSFSFYLHNSLTGRRTSLSEIQSSNGLNFGSGAKQATLYFEADTTKYDQIYMFRSVKLQSVGGVYAGSIMHLDGIYDFTDTTYVTESDNEAEPYASGDIQVYKVSYQLDDIALAMQEVYLDRVLYDEEVPYAGTGVPFEGSLIVSDPLGPTGAITNGPFENALSIANRERNIGEIRWSSLTEKSPELFPINNKYSPDVFQNRVIKLARTGEFAVGFSKDRLYHIRRNGIYLRIEDMHAGYGLVGRDAVASVGPLLYFLTNKGLKAVANNGQIDDVQALDNLFMEDWKEDLEYVKMSFDPFSSCLNILNPVKEQTVCMWFSTGRVTEVHDTNFTDVRTGIWPKSWTNTGTQATVNTSTSMVERSFFLLNHPSTVDSEIPDGWTARVYIQDFDRAKKSKDGTVYPNDQPTVRTLEYNGDPILTVGSVSTVGGVTNIVWTAGNTGNSSVIAGISYDIVGAYAYIISSSDPSKIGEKREVFKTTFGNTGSVTVTTTVRKWSSLAVDDVVALSPVLVRYVGGALPMIRTKDNQVVSSFDLFQNKQISSVGCHFSDVSGGTTGFKFFRGLVYNTTSDSPAVSSFPEDFSGTIIGDSIKAGESDDYAAFTASGLTTRGRHGIQDSALNPGIEVFCPDVDFKLMAVICRGRTTGTDTGERNSS